jgi:hypothetical protein
MAGKVIESRMTSSFCSKPGRLESNIRNEMDGAMKRKGLID